MIIIDDTVFILGFNILKLLFLHNCNNDKKYLYMFN